VPAPQTTLDDYPQERSDSPRPHRADSGLPRQRPETRATRASLGPFPEALEGKLILNHATPIAVEQYRRLAASLHELQASHGTKTIMVTSALPREGKTLTVCNLAMTLSESYGHRVLLIDADLRRPSIHEVFRLSNSTGLSDGLKSDSSALSLVQVSPRLSILPAGRPDPNPMAALVSERMQALIRESAQVFDWILLDVPPVGIMPDANLVARLTDGVVFVLSASTTAYSLVERAISEIGRESIVGVVLNRIDPATIPETGYYQDYYQSSADRG